MRAAQADVQVLPEHDGMIKRTVARGGGVWESPSAPFEVLLPAPLPLQPRLAALDSLTKP